MDLEGFDNLVDQNQDANILEKDDDPWHILRYIDEKWYTPAGRRARWMDLIGDYAGSEPFVIDGDALIEHVLDDELLALGHANGIAFQLLHAKYLLEKIIQNFIIRNAVFSIVFFETFRHEAIGTGDPDHVVASRLLARTQLRNHMGLLNVEVVDYSSLDSPEWHAYSRRIKPMFFMTSESEVLHGKGDTHTDKILVQRLHILRLLSRGIAVTILKGSQFKDTKIMSFVFEPASATSLISEEGTLQHILHDTLLRLEQKQPRVDIPPIDIASFDSMDQAARKTDTKVLSLIASTLSAQSQSAGFPSEIIFFFIVHCLLLPDLPINLRARKSRNLHPKLEKILLQNFIPTAFLVAEHVCKNLPGAGLEVDGHLFAIVLQFCLARRTKSPAFEDLLGSSLFTSAQSICSDSQVELDLLSFIKNFPSPAQEVISTSCSNNTYRLLPIQNHVFDDQLRLVRAEVADDEFEEDVSERAEFDVGVLFKDTKHWHNSRKSILPSHLAGNKPAPVNEWQKMKQLRSHQRFMTILHRQAVTLTGASGGVLERVSIPALGNKRIVYTGQKTTHDHASSGPKGKKDKPLSKKDKLLLERAQEKLNQDASLAREWWSSQLEKLKKLPTEDQAKYLDDEVLRSRRAKQLPLGIELQLYRLQLDFKLWINRPDRSEQSVHDEFALSILRRIKGIFDLDTVDATVFKILSSALTVLGFSNLISSFNSRLSSDANAAQPLQFKFMKLIHSKTSLPVSDYEYMTIKEDPTNWQLRLFGEFMDRSMDSAPDPKKRVQFAPDAWQRKVLDAIDEEASLLVVAPTSAGKTFISFYAMEKVLRESDDGIIVYVAPTKALVTQIAAEIYARFSKDIPNKAMWAVHTRDWRINDPQNCQILVTVPEVLSMMLLSSPLARSWTPRLKRVILDEIHSIGQENSGAVYEQILLLAPCPIIGLSATIGSPEDFNTWLASVQEAHGFKHVYIHHPHRYSHLRKFFYNMNISPGHTFNSLDTYSTTNRSRLLHPISLLHVGARSLPEDLSLEAADLLTLYHSLSRHEELANDLAPLEPTKHLPRDRLLTQLDVIKFETTLKELITNSIMIKPSFMEAVTKALEDPFVTRAPDSQPPSNKKSRIDGSVTATDMFKQNIPFLVADLHAQGDLPAILFNFDRTQCEIIATEMVATLEQAENRWKENSPTWKQKIDAWDAWKRQSSARERQTSRMKRQKKDEDDIPDNGESISWQASFNPDDVLPQFSFAGMTRDYSREELEKDIRELKLRTQLLPWVVPALRRGIAVHHAGMNKSYRGLIESLFRQGFVRIMIATGTLALGINAPTKTSVFCGDSPFLTALMYRQCAGRAGRRGYDLLGKVVFYGLPIDRVRRMVLSKLPPLGGNFPLTTTLTLRLCNLMEGSNYAPVAVNAVKSLLTLSQVSYGSHSSRDQLLHHMRFSLDYLRRFKLLDRECKPMNLYGLASHLYYTEPMNLALVVLMRAGVFHKICNQKSFIDAQHDLIHLLAHLFGRRYLPRSYSTNEDIKLVVKNSPSKVVLPPLPKWILNTLRQNDRQTVRIFATYAKTYTEQHADKMGKDHALPLSGEIVTRKIPEDSPFYRHLRETAIAVTTRSVFAATSGLTDDFGSVEELSSSSRSGLNLHIQTIPSFRELYTDPTKDGDFFALNAYILDFYNHGQVEPLVKANGIRRGDLWYLLQDFDLTLATIKASLEQLFTELSASVNPTEIDDVPVLDTADPESDDEDSSRPGSGDPTVFKRPLGIKDEDWRVYMTIRSAAMAFREKFKLMWA